MHSQDIAAPTVGYRMAILGLSGQGKGYPVALRARQHKEPGAREAIHSARAARSTHRHRLSRLSQHSPARPPYGGKRGVESQGRPRVSITKFRCYFTRAGHGHPWAMPWLYQRYTGAILGYCGVLPQLSGTTQLLPCAYALSYRGSAALACSAVPSLPDIVSICHIRRFQIPAQTLLPATEQSKR